MTKEHAEQIRDAKKAAKRAYALSAEEESELKYAMTLSVNDYTAPASLEKLSKEHRRVFEAYVSYVRQATHSKGIENDTWWRAGDLEGYENEIGKSGNENGTRSQSWSDFQVIHLMDYIASIIELSAKGGKEHAYTKVPDFAILMGNTGVMINLSLIPTAEYNGSLEYDPKEGMDFAVALELRERFPDTVGTICIGINDMQIKQLLADNEIDYVIPYHASGMSKVVRELMKMPGWESYQNSQNEKKLSGGDAAENAKRYGVDLYDESDPLWHKKVDFSDWFSYDEAAEDQAKNATADVMTGGYIAMRNQAEKYKKECARRGLAPKFSYGKGNFVDEANYWKLLIDRKMVNQKTGEIINQRTVTPEFNEDDIMGILDRGIEKYNFIKDDQEYAVNRVVSEMIRDMSGTDKMADLVQLPVDEVTVPSIVESSKYESLIRQGEDLELSFSPKIGSTEEITTDQTQSSNGSNADSGFSNGEKLYSFTPSSQDPLRASIEQGDEIRRTTLQENLEKHNNQAMNDALVELFNQDPETYDPVSNQQTLDKARQLLSDEQWKKRFMRKLMRFNANDILSKDEIAAGVVLINNAKNNGNLEETVSLIRAFSRKTTNIARSLQAISMLSRMSPEGMLKSAIRTVDNANDKVMFDSFSDYLRDTADDVFGRLESARENGEINLQEVIKIVNALEEINIDPRVKRVIKQAVEKAKNGKSGGMTFDQFANKLLLATTAEQVNGTLLELLGLSQFSNEEVGKIMDLATEMNDLNQESDKWKAKYQELMTIIASKIRNSKWDNLNAWRKFAMLANLKTHERNFFSNAVYSVTRSVDSAIASGISDILGRFDMLSANERTAYFGWSLTDLGKRIGEKVTKAAEVAAKEMSGEKYGFSYGDVNRYRDYGRIDAKSNAGKVVAGALNNTVVKAFNKANDFNSKYLDKEDAVFFRRAYRDYLGQWMVAHGEENITPAAKNYAEEMALEATFRTKSAVTETINGIKRSSLGNGKVGKIAGAAIDIMMPFVNTPVNIAGQMVMHSPIGLIAGTAELINATKGRSGKTIAHAINNLAKGINGTILMGIGILLGSAGLFHIRYGKTEKERMADEAAGYAENSFTIGGVSVSLDWLQPTSAPLIAGASVAERIAEDGLDISTVFGAIMDATDSLFEMSMLQGIYDTFGGQGNGVSETVIGLGENLISSMIPTLIGQFARAGDPYQRMVSDDNIFTDSWLGDVVGGTVASIAAKTPGLSYLLNPRTDVFGELVTRTGNNSIGNFILNGIGQIAIPATIKTATRRDEVTSELLDLYYSDEKKHTYALPTQVKKDKTDSLGLDLITARQVIGEEQLKAVTEVMSSKKKYAVYEVLPSGRRVKRYKFYRDMTADEKLRVIGRTFDNVKDEALDDEKRSKIYKEIIERMSNR